MSQEKTPTKFQAWCHFAFSLVPLGIAAHFIGKWARTGTLEFSAKSITATGPVAAFEIGLCVIGGLFLLFSALRQLRKYYIF